MACYCRHKTQANEQGISVEMQRVVVANYGGGTGRSGLFFTVPE